VTVAPANSSSIRFLQGCAAKDPEMQTGKIPVRKRRFLALAGVEESGNLPAGNHSRGCGINRSSADSRP
jgi:hypothetical protein